MRRRGSFDPRRAKKHRGYSVAEVAALYGAHINTVRGWLKRGLPSLRVGGLILVLGEDLSDFLRRRRATKRSKTPPGHLFCLGCKTARRPAPGALALMPLTGKAANVTGRCPVCNARMFRRVALANLDACGFGAVRPERPQLHLVDSPAPSLICHQPGAR